VKVGVNVFADPIVEVTNNGTSGLVAFELAMTNSAGAVASRIFADRLISPPHRALLPGDTMTVQVPYRLRSALTSMSPLIVAALFQDGATTGEPAEAAKLRIRRQCMWKEDLALQSELRRDLADGESRATVLAGLAADAKTVSAAPSGLCRDGGGYAVAVAEAGMRDDRIDGITPGPSRLLPMVIRTLEGDAAWAKPLPLGLR
jgi:hypothetical protein